jgi:AmmeMemoRadiSam system protein B
VTAFAVRPPAVAGTFYPGDPTDLRRTVDGLLAAATPGPAAKGFVVPHAGYVYSGPVAASAYAGLRAAQPAVRRVVLLGPAHRFPLAGLALPAATAFATPLGAVAVDEEARHALRGLVRTSDAPHRGEHALEVQLPFLQRVLPAGFTLVPLVVGQAAEEEVGVVLEALWGGDETLVLLSTDLSHYLSWTEARALDADTAARILDARPVEPGTACGAYPLNGLLHVVRARGLAVRQIDLRNSGDTAGGRDRVVGYGTFAVDAA